MRYPRPSLLTFLLTTTFTLVMSLSSLAGEIKIDISTLSVISRCQAVSELKDYWRAEGVKLIWQTCISGNHRRADRSGRFPDYFHNPEFNESEACDYRIKEVEKSTGWTKRLIGGKVTDYGEFQLFREGDPSQPIASSKPFGHVKTGGRIGDTYFFTQGSAFRFKGVKRTEPLNELIQAAKNSFHD